jgi:hypothetical protein
MRRLTLIYFTDTQDIRDAVDVIFDYITDEIGNKLLPLFSLAVDEFNNPASLKLPLKRKADWENAMEVCYSILLI